MFYFTPIGAVDQLKSVSGVTKNSYGAFRENASGNN